jgi:hypothetical protein
MLSRPHHPELSSPVCPQLLPPPLRPLGELLRMRAVVILTPGTLRPLNPARGQSEAGPFIYPSVRPSRVCRSSTSVPSLRHESIAGGGPSCEGWPTEAERGFLASSKSRR